VNRTIKLLALVAACAAVSISSYALAETLERNDPAGAAVTRELPWDGSESLSVEVPATVRFVQSGGEAKVVVTGARRSVEAFSASGGVLRDGRLHTGKPLEIVVYAPRITRFLLKGSDKLVVEAFDQPELRIETVGRAEVRASGKTARMTLQLQGFGWADLGALEAAEADLSLTGSRHAIVSVSERARVTGNGSVVLVRKPKSLELDLGDSGRVFTLGDAQAQLR
jgi:putative autotransporter adhesin-like protein